MPDESVFPPLGLPTFAPLAARDQRTDAILFAVGCLEYMIPEYLHALFYAPGRWTTLYRDIRTLLDAGLLCGTNKLPLTVQRDPWAVRPGTPPPKRPTVLALTKKGQQALQKHVVKGDSTILDRLRVHTAELPVSDPRNIGHDLMVSWFCTEVLAELALNAFCQSVYVQIEYTTRAQVQRFDAVIVARLTRQRRRVVTGQIPWFDGVPRLPDEIQVVIAVEADRGTESWSQIAQKGQAYHLLTADRTYDDLLGAVPIPVFVGPTQDRLRELAMAWRISWPGGPGLVSTPLGGSHPSYGVLWGTHWLALRDGQEHVPSLLSVLFSDGVGTLRHLPVFSLPEWLLGRAGVRAITALPLPRDTNPQQMREPAAVQRDHRRLHTL